MFESCILTWQTQTKPFHNQEKRNSFSFSFLFFSFLFFSFLFFSFSNWKTNDDKRVGVMWKHLRPNSFLSFFSTHRCTAVGNPGRGEGGHWGFGIILLRGVLEVAKGPYFRVLLHFYDHIFKTLPPSTAPPPVYNQCFRRCK